MTGPCPIYLAPMAAFTNSAMRLVSRQFGADRTYTEMVNGAGLLHDSDKSWALLETLPGETGCLAHLYGSDPVVMGEAAARVDALGRFEGIDLNAGCPVPRITAHGAGAALIHEPDRIGRILSAMVRATRLPVSVKTRLGPHPQKLAIFDILAAAEEAGAAELILHGRFTSQGHGGNVHLDLLAEVKQRSKIRIVGNGGIRSAADAQAMRATGVDALMVARGAIGNPWIFQAIRDSFTAKPSEQPPSPDARFRVPRDLAEIRRVLVLHLETECALRRQLQTGHILPDDALSPEDAIAIAFRCHLFRYLNGLKGATWLRTHLNTYRGIPDILAAVDLCLEREAAFRAQAPWTLPCEVTDAPLDDSSPPTA